MHKIYYTIAIMEKRISSKTRLYFQNFKDVLKDKL